MTNPTPDFRTELARLVDLYYALGGNWSPHGYTDTWNDALASARAALATPPPEQKSSIDDLIAGCKPLDPDMAESLTTEARWRLLGEDARADLATAPPEAPPTPDLSALAAIGERLRTQDNCGTADPIFQVRGLRRIYGMDPDYADEPVWIYTEDGAIEIDPPEDPENPGEFVIQTGYIDIWDVLAVAFTKEGCEEHLKLNGHSYRHGYKKVKIYAVYIYRCPEMLAIREALMALPGESAPPPGPDIPTKPQPIGGRQVGPFF